jgi:predicted CXXCH cytochrome family protein
MNWVWRGTASAILVLASGGCVDEKIVYRDNPAFVTPPAAAAGFLGYADTTEGRTVCGNCHVGQQGKWSQTAHSDAWESLQASGHASESCEGCHSIGDKGNAGTDANVAYAATGDTRYHDVQCESCHGAGLTHVSGPARGQMLASIHADTGASVTDGCAECHAGTHHPFVEEWRASRHGRPNDHTFTTTGEPNPSCRSCHVGQYALVNLGVNTNYTEKSGATNLANSEGVTCVVCHDPHGSTHPKQLRLAVDTKDPETNLCAKCHNRRSTPDWQGSRDEPHAPHGPLVFGTAGWWPQGIEFLETQSTHGSDANPRLCAGCHVQHYDVNDAQTGAFQVTVVGHRWLAIPCVDANGQPTAEQKDEDGNRLCQITSVSFKACATGGCHGNSEVNARSAWVAGDADVKGLADLLNQMVVQVPSNQFGAGKNTPGRGAKFNVAMARMPGAAAHNPFLVKTLLRYSGLALNEAYGIPIPPGLAPTAADARRVRITSSSE